MDNRRWHRPARPCLPGPDQLNDGDDEAAVERLCARQGPSGPVAAVCVWPRLAAFARRRLLPGTVVVAAVANFPERRRRRNRRCATSPRSPKPRAQEVDVVLPHRAWPRDDATRPPGCWRPRAVPAPGWAQVILETGDVRRGAGPSRPAARAGRGADFLKTSTGRCRWRHARRAAHHASAPSPPHARGGEVGFGRHPHRGRRRRCTWAWCTDAGPAGAGAGAFSHRRQRPARRHRGRVYGGGRRARVGGSQRTAAAAACWPRRSSAQARRRALSDGEIQAFVDRSCRRTAALERAQARRWRWRCCGAAWARPRRWR